ncbi:MAG: beta-galactosidase trimerization domain-containing protein, partial [Victivallales bacterium]|nr:beta-galactosidase trimerization domain-containing protein [Victivallales bacterium]
MNTPKLPHHMRIAALQCNFEGGEENTLRVPKFWSECGFDTEQLFHPIGELYSAVFDKEKHGRIFGEYMDKSTEAGVSIILYLNCHILLESQNNMAEEWAQVLPDESYRKLYETYFSCCLNSSWMDYFSDLIGDLAEYPIAGIFFDGPINLSCHCPRCSAKFAETHGKPLSDATEKELGAFSLRTQIDAKKLFTSRTKEINPEWISYFNEGVMQSGCSTEEMREALSYNDIVGTEGGFQFGGPPKQTDLWRCGVSARMTEAVADGKPTIIFMAGDHKPWSWYLHTPAETKLCYASTIANGASVWYGIHCSTDSLKGETGAAMREMVGFDKQHSEMYQNTKSLAKVAVFRSFDTAKSYTSTGEETDLYASGSKEAGGIGNYSESFNGAVATLFRSNIPFDIVTELNIDDLAKYAVVLAPTAACLNTSIVTAFENFVSEGGCLIADSEFGLYDEEMRRLDAPASADLIGVDCEGYRKYKQYDYFTFSEKGANLADPGVEFTPAPLVALEIKPRDGTNLLAELCHSLPGRYA